MSDALKGRRVAILVTDGVEQVELTEPRKALEQAGAHAEIVSSGPGTIQGFNDLDRADTFAVDRTVDRVTAADYDALLLPGGVANADRLRTDERAVRFVREIAQAGKPVAAICHAPWMLVEAGVVRGRTLTSWPSLKTDIRNAGGRWVDEEVCTDAHLVTSRKPADLPAFCRKMIEEFAGPYHAGRCAAPPEAAEAQPPEDAYDEVVEDSFPASDPPSTTPFTSVGAPDR